MWKTLWTMWKTPVFQATLSRRPYGEAWIKNCIEGDKNNTGSEQGKGRAVTARPPFCQDSRLQMALAARTPEAPA